ncbi:MAG: ABC-2 family transporter protein, partial [Nocardioides sp.]|nr:ABC-2 family transporter protein [Nocardioides sp.]
MGIVRDAPRQYAWIALMWIRAALAYPASFWIMTVSSAIITGLDFVGIAIMFATVDTLGAFGLREIALLYGASGFALGLADMAIGSVEQIGQHVRTGSLDTMMTRPVPLLVQVCADKFALR